MSEELLKDSFVSDLLYECSMNTERLCKVFFPDRFFMPFSPSIHTKIFKILDDDKIQKAVIEAPRSIGKTSIVNLACPASNILFRKRHYIVPISASATSAVEQSENLKNELISNPTILRLFGNMKSDAWSQEGWAVKWNDAFATKVLPRGAGQQVRGLLFGNYRPDLIIIDDLEDPEHIDSDDQRLKKKLWFFNDVMKSVAIWSRKKDWRILLLGTMLHEDSLLENLMDDKGWEHLRLEICDDDFNSNWEDAITREELIKIFQEHEAQNITDSFYRELRNQCVPRGKGTFTPTMFKYYSERAETDKSRIETVILYDPARTSQNDKAADTAVVAVGFDRKNNLLKVRDIVSGRMHPDEQYNVVLEMATRYRAGAIGIETTGLEEFIYYPFINEMMRRNLHFEVIPLHARKGKRKGEGKIDRVAALIPFYRQGLVVHNSDCLEVPKLENQLLMFPKSKKWDIMDALAYIVEMLDEGDRYFAFMDVEDSPEDIEKEFADDDVEAMLEYEELV